MKKWGGRFLQELRGEVRKLFMHFPPKFLQKPSPLFFSWCISSIVYMA